MTRPRTIVLVWLVCLLAAGLWVGRMIEVRHDLQAFLPGAERSIEKLLLSRAASGAVSRLVFVAFEGGGPEDRQAASRDALDALERLGGVEQVANGAGGFETDAFAPLRPFRFLLGAPPSFDAEALRAALETRLNELRSPLAAIAKSGLESDPTASFRGLLRHFGESTTEPRREGGVWVTQDGARSLMLVTIADGGGDLGREETIVRAMTRTLEAVADERGVRVLLAGRPALAAAARKSIRASFVTGGAVASLLVITLLLWLFRSAGVLLLGVLPLASGVLAGLAAVLAVFGGVHGMALAFGVTLLGIAVDYPLHLFSHHHAGRPLGETAKNIERPLLLGALTTATAFALFGAARTSGLGQLACFTGTGVLAAVLTLRYVTPALAGMVGVEPRPRSWRLLPEAAPAWLAPATAAVAIAAVAWLPFRGEALFGHDISALNPLPDSAKALDRKLRADLGAPDLRHLLLIGADDPETVLRRSETLAGDLRTLVAEGDLTGFDAPSRYLPSRALQAERQRTLPEPAVLAEALRQAGEGLPFKPGLFQPFLDAVEESRQRVPLDAEAGRTLFAATPLGDRLDQLFLRHDGRWHGFLPLIGVGDIERLRALASAHGDVNLVDLKAFSNGLLAEAGAEALRLLALSIGGAVLLLILLRHPPRAIAGSLAVLLLALAVTAAILSLIGERFTMLHMLAALLVVGLGIDYSVFFAWRGEHDERTVRTRQSLIACLLSTVVVFGLLAMSSIGVLRAIGLTVAVGACTSFVFAYAILSKRAG